MTISFIYFRRAGEGGGGREQEKREIQSCLQHHHQGVQNCEFIDITSRSITYCMLNPNDIDCNHTAQFKYNFVRVLEGTHSRKGNCVRVRLTCLTCRVTRARDYVSQAPRILSCYCPFTQTSPHTSPGAISTLDMESLLKIIELTEKNNLEKTTDDIGVYLYVFLLFLLKLFLFLAIFFLFFFPHYIFPQNFIYLVLICICIT